MHMHMHIHIHIHILTHIFKYIHATNYILYYRVNESLWGGTQILSERQFNLLKGAVVDSYQKESLWERSRGKR